MSSDVPVDAGKMEVLQAGELHLHRHRGVKKDVEFR